MKYIQRWKHLNILMRGLGIFGGLCKILDGLVILFSLGFLYSNFELGLSRYRALYKIKRDIKINAQEVEKYVQYKFKNFLKSRGF